MRKIGTTFLALILFACTKEQNVTENTISDSAHQIVSDTMVIAPGKIEDSMAVRKAITQMNAEILKLLKDQDYENLATYIHPEKGLRFSMYAFVDLQKDKLFSRAEYLKFVSKETKFTFGAKDGTGDLYVTPLPEYLENWVYKRNFADSELYVNRFKGTGNSLNNLSEIYPNAVFTENYIAGTEQYGGMDWNALRLVFENFHGTWYLVAIINDEWTT